MATIKDIADRLGIAVSTVSKGLNGANDISEDLRQLVLDTAVEMGYTTKKMRKVEHRKLCVFIENMDYDTNEQFGYDVILGFKQAAIQEKWDVDVVSITPELQIAERYSTYMLKNGYTGAFLIGIALGDEWMEQIATTTIPTVLFDNHVPKNLNVGYVGTDNYEGIDLAIDYLSDLGHTKIALLNGSDGSLVSEQRLDAYMESMHNHGLPVDENLTAFGFYVADCAKYYVPDFLDRGATAILCSSDLIAQGAIAECQKRGLLVPEDISVIGFDDLPVAARMTPPLTTIRQDRCELGKSAYHTLSCLVRHVSISKTLMRAQLIRRNSTGICTR
ncbi:MAG: LacI family DNA-binding transcriptional regulator [Lachnospiraceae bacterium]|nr:LacI family DNA-binding transcriptional regulator [Lachnospiraceae bacterium]